MKKLDVVKMVLLIINILLLVGIFILLVKNNNVSFISHHEKLIYEKNIPDKISNIVFDVTSFDIKIDYNEGAEIVVKAYSSNDDQLTLTIDSDILNIASSEKKCVGFCFNNGNKNISITLPKDMEYDLKVNGISSDINSNIPLKKVNIKTTSGDISLKEVLDSSIEVVSGDISIDKISQNTKIETVSGDVLVRDLFLENNSSISTTSGDVMIKEINTDLLLDLSTVSGDKKNNYYNENASITLKIKTISGDISIN